MTDRICTNGHVIDGSERARSGNDVCSRCGAPEAVDASAQENTTMTDENQGQADAGEQQAADQSSNEGTENTATDDGQDVAADQGSDEAKAEEATGSDASAEGEAEKPAEQASAE